jgi:phage-related baseplate assembly protein
VNSLEVDGFPSLSRLLSEINSAIALATPRPIEERGATETAPRIRQRILAVFAHATTPGQAASGPAAAAKAALKPVRRRRQPALSAPE